MMTWDDGGRVNEVEVQGVTGREQLMSVRERIRLAPLAIVIWVIRSPRPGLSSAMRLHMWQDEIYRGVRDMTTRGSLVSHR